MGNGGFSVMKATMISSQNAFSFPEMDLEDSMCAWLILDAEKHLWIR